VTRSRLGVLVEALSPKAAEHDTSPHHARPLSGLPSL